MITSIFLFSYFNVTFASAPPHLLFNVNEFEWEGMEADREVELNFLYVDHDYAETFGLEIVAGREKKIEREKN